MSLRNFEKKSVFACTTLLLLSLTLFMPAVMSSIMVERLIQSHGNIFYPNRYSELHVEGSQIKNSANYTVYLRGAGKLHWDDDPTGWWWPKGGAWYQNYLQWDEKAIRDHLRVMRSWGMNVVRFHTVAEWWIQDYVTLKNYTGSYRNNLKQAIQICNEEGMYVIMDLFSVKSGAWVYENDYVAPSIPFPPYLNSQEEIAIFPNKQAFVDYWRSVASELKIYNNVLFELYNEPNDHDLNGVSFNEAKLDWFDGMQKAIDAIRSTGAQNIIIPMWGLGVIPSLSYTWMDWVAEANLQDPTGNLVYSGHLYRTYYNPSWSDAYNYTNCLAKMELVKFKYVIETLNKPVIISEIGVNMWSSDTEVNPSGLTNLQEELAWATNVFDICNKWGISYVAWSWAITDTWHLIDGLSTPSAWGQVLIDSIADGGTIIIT